MSRDVVLELLVKNYFTKLAIEVQLKRKKEGKADTEARPDLWES